MRVAILCGSLSIFEPQELDYRSLVGEAGTVVGLDGWDILAIVQASVVISPLSSLQPKCASLAFSPQYECRKFYRIFRLLLWLTHAAMRCRLKSFKTLAGKPIAHFRNR
jgi:hypothetical protein